MTPIQFFAAGCPRGQPRARAFAMKGVGVRMYDPGTAEGWKGLVAAAARPFLGQIPKDHGPLFLHLEFFMPRPKSHMKGTVIRDNAPGYHTGKPDADNLAKAVMDALTQLNMWRDDAAVADLRARKLFDDGRGPGCIIYIREAMTRAEDGK